MLWGQPSTRTRTGFELAAQRLGVHYVSLDLGTSSLEKGETLQATVDVLMEMVDAIVIRHEDFEELRLDMRLVNAGSRYDHPSQALADLIVLDRHTPGPVYVVPAPIGHYVRTMRAFSKRRPYMVTNSPKDAKALYVTRESCPDLLDRVYRPGMLVLHPGPWTPDQEFLVDEPGFLGFEQAREGISVKEQMLKEALGLWSP